MMKIITVVGLTLLMAGLMTTKLKPITTCVWPNTCAAFK